MVTKNNDIRIHCINDIIIQVYSSCPAFPGEAFVIRLGILYFLVMDGAYYRFTSEIVHDILRARPVAQEDQHKYNKIVEYVKLYE
jgi:hypothetical protein